MLNPVEEAFAPGTFDLNAELDDRARAGCHAPARRGAEAHPIFAFIAALGGAGVSIERLCELCGSSIAAGPVLATCRMTMLAPLTVNREYTISASILDRVEKPSSRFGSAMHARIGFTVSSDGARFAEVELLMILPRGGKAIV